MEPGNSPDAELMEEVYEELRKLARSFLRRERPDHTLQTSALVHEAYLRLTHNGHLEPQDRAAFYTAAARSMRRVLVDYARRRNSKKRDGGMRVELPTDYLPSVNLEQNWVLVDQALNRLAAMDQRQAQIVEMRIFAGLTNPEIAEALSLSEATVKRSWVLAKAWLAGELS